MKGDFSTSLEMTISMEEELHWYAMKVFYNKVFDMEDLLEAYHIESFIAVQREEQTGKAHSLAARKLAGERDRIGKRKFIQQGPMIFKRNPIIASLMFFRADEEKLAIVSEKLFDPVTRKSHGFIYKSADGKGYSVIPDIQMESFRLAVSAWNNGWEVVDVNMVLDKGDKVHVIDGPMKGAEGFIKRIGKDKRLLVCIEGVIAVATSYIPRQFLEKVAE